LECPLFYPHGVRGPLWTERPQQWRAAADCEHLDTFVTASQLDHLDVTVPEVRGPATPEDLLGGPQYGYAAPILSGIGGLLARAHLRREQGNLAAAEADLRALLALGALLVRDTPNIQLMQFGHLAVDHAAAHLADLLRDQVRTEEADRLSSFRATLPDREGCSGLVKTTMPFTAVVSDGIPVVAEVAQRQGLPLAIRIGALTGLRLRYLQNPTELLLGPSHTRLEAAQGLSADPALHLWWEDTDAFRFPVGDRIQQLLALLT
jgi:hypothetical protein